jgi:capsular polysaccharide biosynthesis protein
MELNNYWSIIKRNWYISVILCLVFGIFAYYNYTKQPISYSGTITFTVGNNSSAPANQYDYDKFYNVSATSYLADTLSGWLGSPDFVNKVYQNAGSGTPNTKLTNLAKTIKTTKNTLTSSVVVAQMEAGSHEETEKLLTSAGKTVNDELDSMKSRNVIPSQLTISASQPFVVDQKNNPYIAIAIAVIAGLIVGVVISLFLEAIRQSR